MTTSKKQTKSMNGQPMNEMIFQSIMGEYLSEDKRDLLISSLKGE